MKKIFLVLMALSSFTALGNPLGGNPTDGYCQTVDGSACGWGGGSSSSRRVYKVPNRWGAIYYNPANRAFGYSDNNTKGYRDAEKEALASCIKAGGGQNPIASDGKGCRLVTKNRNSCSAIAMGKDKGYAIESDDSLDVLERKVLEACSEYSDSCKVRYSACSRHPDYRY